jgi:CubicO group peptidase (beta-lactamase class C family)
VFVSGRDAEEVMGLDLRFVQDYGVDAKVERDNNTATASIFGLVKRTVVYRPGLGCTLALDISEDDLKKQKGPEPAPVSKDELNMLWPKGEAVTKDLPPGVDGEQLERALDGAFTEPDPEASRHTRAVVVVYDGRIVAERYAPGFSRDTPLIGWSMTKSVTNAMVGILVHKGMLNINDPAPVPEWRKSGDPRKIITTDQLLRMSSGLEFHEEYESDPNSDCNVMLFVYPDAAAFAADKPLELEPDGKWSYSSGTTNIISRIVRHTLEKANMDYLSFPRDSLFDKLGMRSAVIEPDPSGTFIGSSNMYATARDWSRFGLLYLQDGVWEGERVLPEGWVDYSTTPTPEAPPNRSYGAQWWLNRGGKDRWMPRLPQDLYSARGHEGQFVTVIPSRNVVVVRLGYTVNHKAHWDHESFLLDILKALPE